MSKFKVGDQVKCINVDIWADDKRHKYLVSTLELNKIYTVKQAEGSKIDIGLKEGPMNDMEVIWCGDYRFEKL